MNPSPRWTLDARAFELLLAALAPQREAAAVRYEELRVRLIRVLRWERTSDPEALADEAFTRLARRLAEGEPVIRWWRGLKHPSPLLMSEEEVHHSSDSFPIEFHDMKERRRVLYGPDVIADLHVDRKYHRVQVEHDLRAKLFRLRQQGAAVLSNPEALLK